MGEWVSEGSGTGLFLLLHSTHLLLIRGPRSAIMPSFYLDQHGEVRHGGWGGREGDGK